MPPGGVSCGDRRRGLEGAGTVTNGDVRLWPGVLIMTGTRPSRSASEGRQVTPLTNRTGRGRGRARGSRGV